MYINLCILVVYIPPSSLNFSFITGLIFTLPPRRSTILSRHYYKSLLDVACIFSNLSFTLQGDCKNCSEISFGALCTFFCKLLNHFLPPSILMPPTYTAITSPRSLSPPLYNHPLTTMFFPCQEPGEALLASSSVQVTGCVPDRADANKSHE